MTINVEVSHNGKKYKTLEEAFDNAVISGVTKMIQNKLVIFSEELSQTGGYVEVVFNDEDFYNPQVLFHDMPNELAIRMKEHLLS